MSLKDHRFLLLVTNLPGRNQALRMRIWRALNAAGAALLRDGVYVLPDTSNSRQVFEQQARGINAVAGSVHVLSFRARSTEQQRVLVALFDRTLEYQELITRLGNWRQQLLKTTELEARKTLATITRDVEAVTTTDFYPGIPQSQMQGAIGEAEALLKVRFSPDEPQPAHRKIPRRLAKHFQGKTWVTREHMWIDRVCSAWLIRRFIDPKARFLWVKDVTRKPKHTVGFDFDGAQFTHVDTKVTFEVLMTSFGLDGDVGLSRMGRLVHFLDVGGIPVAEAPGFAAIISGARSLHASDEQLLLSVGSTLDSLYQSYLQEGDSSAVIATLS